MLGQYFGFKIVPNGIFVDTSGKIRLLKQGFRVNEDAHAQAVLDLLQGKLDQVELEDVYYEPPTATALLEQQLAAAKFKLATEYVKQGRVEEALVELDAAIVLDSDNFLIRKQRWYLRHPEKFSPTIDIDWQQTQLATERAAEAALKGTAECGPEGCVIPGT